jgi:hypothetical protein
MIALARARATRVLTTRMRPAMMTTELEEVGMEDNEDNGIWMKKQLIANSMDVG